MFMTDNKKQPAKKTNSAKKAPAKKSAAKKKAPAKKKPAPKVSVNDAASSLHDAIGDVFVGGGSSSPTSNTGSYVKKNWLKDFFKKLFG